MSEDNSTKKQVLYTSPKNELWKAYKALEKQLAEKEELQLKPQKIVEEKAKKEIIQKVDGLSVDSVSKAIMSLKSESTMLLGKLQENLEREIKKYEDIQSAINVKENELKDIFEIEKSAHALAALIEAQNQKKNEFEQDMDYRKSTTLREIENLRAEWEKEKKEHEILIKERDEKEKKDAARQKEEYEYNFKRDKQITQDKLADELNKKEKEFNVKLESKIEELNKRESVIKEQEDHANQLKNKVEQFQQELDETVAQAVDETSKRLIVENKSKQEFLVKEFEGQKNVLTTKIESYEKTISEQEKRINELSKKLDEAYAKVQDVAVKAIESSSSSKMYNEFQKALSDKYTNKTKD